MDKINIVELSRKIKEEEYSEDYAEAKLCQDIILELISKSIYVSNVTVKGGVVMRSISRNMRRATIDIDIDFIRYSLSDESIEKFISNLTGISGIQIQTIGEFEKLKHQDYEGKRIHVLVKDEYGNTLSSKIDIGVHKNYNLPQDEYCFDLSFDNEGATLFINSREQILVEKLKSLLKFGILSTRYKDIFDIYYLTNFIDKSKLMIALNTLIFADEHMRERNVEDIETRLKSIFSNNNYLNKIESSKKNWLDVELEEVLNGIIVFFGRIKN